MPQHPPFLQLISSICALRVKSKFCTWKRGSCVAFGRSRLSREVPEQALVRWRKEMKMKRSKCNHPLKVQRGRKWVIEGRVGGNLLISLASRRPAKWGEGGRRGWIVYARITTSIRIPPENHQVWRVRKTLDKLEGGLGKTKEEATVNRWGGGCQPGRSGEGWKKRRVGEMGSRRLGLTERDNAERWKTRRNRRRRWRLSASTALHPRVWIWHSLTRLLTVSKSQTRSWQCPVPYFVPIPS